MWSLFWILFYFNLNRFLWRSLLLFPLWILLFNLSSWRGKLINASGTIIGVWWPLVFWLMIIISRRNLRLGIRDANDSTKTSRIEHIKHSLIHYGFFLLTCIWANYNISSPSDKITFTFDRITNSCNKITIAFQLVT